MRSELFGSLKGGSALVMVASVVVMMQKAEGGER